MNVRLVMTVVLTLGLLTQSLASVRVAQADTSKKCPVGHYWTCSQFGCYCQPKGGVY
jgi:hypothetical protein